MLDICTKRVHNLVPFEKLLFFRILPRNGRFWIFCGPLISRHLSMRIHRKSMIWDNWMTHVKYRKIICYQVMCHMWHHVFHMFSNFLWVIQWSQGFRFVWTEQLRSPLVNMMIHHSGQGGTLVTGAYISLLIIRPNPSTDNWPRGQGPPWEKPCNNGLFFKRDRWSIKAFQHVIARANAYQQHGREVLFGVSLCWRWFFSHQQKYPICQGVSPFRKNIKTKKNS